MGPEIIVPVSICAMIAAIVLVPRYYKSKERERLQDTIRAAIEKGQALPPEVLDTMTRDIRPQRTAAHDLRVGMVWIAVAIGLAGFGYAMSSYADEAMPPFLGFAALPGAVGLAFILMSLFNKTKS